MKVVLSSLLVVQILLQPLISWAYDFSHSTLRKTPKGPYTVALVPFAERSSTELKEVLERFRRELSGTKGVRIMEERSTNDVLAYYLKYVDASSNETSLQVTLTEARQSLLEGNYEQADSLLNDVEGRIETIVAAGGSNEGLYETYLLRAKIYHANGSKDKVQEEYDRVARLYPELELDANLYSNWERDALKKAKQKLKDAPKGTLAVSSTALGGEVLLNGIHRGIAPMTFKDLPIGKYVVEVKTVHFAPFVTHVEVTENEKQEVQAKLHRTSIASAEFDEGRGLVIQPSRYKTDLEISKLIATLGYHMGVDRVILVSDNRSGGIDSLLYRIGDTGLGSVRKEQEVAINEDNPDVGIEKIVTSMNKEVKTDILKNPKKYAKQSVGSIKLHQMRHKAFYKRPLFWVMTAAAAGTGGALAAVLAPAAAVGGILIAF